MSVVYYTQNRSPIAIVMGIVSGLFFGIIMALYQRRSEKRLQKLGLSAADMNPAQDRTIPLPLDAGAALARATDALTAIRKLRPNSIQTTGNLISATTGMTWQSFGERISIEVQAADGGSVIRVASRPRMSTTVMDGGKGRENVELFAKALAQ